MSHDTLEYLLNSGAWSLIGLGIGYTIGRLEVRAERRNNASSHEPCPDERRVRHRDHT